MVGKGGARPRSEEGVLRGILWEERSEGERGSLLVVILKLMERDGIPVISRIANGQRKVVGVELTSRLLIDAGFCWRYGDVLSRWRHNALAPGSTVHGHLGISVGLSGGRTRNAHWFRQAT